jgi:hypothetical protein
MLLLETFSNLSAWLWVLVLALAGLGVLALWLATNREDPGQAPWAGLIPAYVLLAIAALVGLLEFDALQDPFVAPFVLAVIALPFLVTFLRDRRQWWALIPAYILLAVGLMVLLTDSGLMSDDLVPPYVLFAIAVPFFVVYARNTKNWWALIPGGILAIVGISFLIAEAAVEYVGAIVLVVVGLWIVVRQFTGKASGAEPGPSQAETTLEAKAQEHPDE